MLTPMQHRCHAEICAFYEANGFAPSYDELKARLDLKSKSSIARLVAGLEERGFVRVTFAKARGLTPMLRADGSPYPNAAFEQVLTAAERAAKGDAMLARALESYRKATSTAA